MTATSTPRLRGRRWSTSNGEPGILQVDGAFTRRGEAPDGIVVSSLEDAVAEHPELVERYLGSLLTDRDRFTAQNTAEWRGGMFVYVPAGVRVEQPVVTSVLHDSASAIHWRSLIVVEEGAEVTRHRSSGHRAPTTSRATSTPSPS